MEERKDICEGYERDSVQQLDKLAKDKNERFPIYPLTYIQAVYDARTKERLDSILWKCNNVYLPWMGSAGDTRIQLPFWMRRKGIIITYKNLDEETITEKLTYDLCIADDFFRLDSSWTRITDALPVGGNITIGSNGNWFQDGVDTGFKAQGPKGDNGLTPMLRTVNNKLRYSYDGEVWNEISEYIAAWFRYQDNKIQISRDQKTWSDLSKPFTQDLYIKGYVATSSALPSTGVKQGDIYMVGPTYAAEDTEHKNPIYRMYVYNDSGWRDNGVFQSIAAGVVQTIGNSETEVMSQKAISEIVGFNDFTTFGEDYEYAEGEVVRHEGLLYVFTKSHTKAPWVGTDAKPISLKEALLPKISQLLLESSGGITYSATLTNDPTGDSVIPRILPVKAGRIYKISVHSDIPLSDKASVGLGGNGSIIIGNVTEATVYKKATVDTNNARVYMENCTSGANVTVNIRDISTDYTVIPTFELNHEDEYLKPGVYVRNDNASYRDSALMQVSYNNVTKTVTQVVSQIVHGTSNPYIKFRNGTIGEDGNITFESWEPLYLSMAKMSGKWVSNTDPTDTTGLGFYPIYDGNTYEITLKTDSLIGCSISLPDFGETFTPEELYEGVSFFGQATKFYRHFRIRKSDDTVDVNDLHFTIQWLGTANDSYGVYRDANATFDKAVEDMKNYPAGKYNLRKRNTHRGYYDFYIFGNDDTSNRSYHQLGSVGSRFGVRSKVIERDSYADGVECESPVYYHYFSQDLESDVITTKWVTKNRPTNNTNAWTVIPNIQVKAGRYYRITISSPSVIGGTRFTLGLGYNYNISLLDKEYVKHPFSSIYKARNSYPSARVYILLHEGAEGIELTVSLQDVTSYVLNEGYRGITYTGDKIVLPSVNKGNIQRLGMYCMKNNITYEGATLSSQGCDIYNNYLVRLYDKGYCQIFDVSNNYNMFELAKFPLGSYSETVKNHCNSASFAPSKREGEEFPLLYVSTLLKNICRVEQLTLNGSVTVQSISFSSYFDKHTLNVIAGDDGYLWAIGIGRTGDASTPVDSLRFCKFNMPNPNDGDIILSEHDIIDQWIEDGYNYEESVSQGCCVNDGKIYFVFGTESSNRQIKVYDTTSHELTNQINLNNVIIEEPEDCTIYEGALWVAINNGLGVYRLTL